MLRLATAGVPSATKLHLMEVASGRRDVLAVAASALRGPKSQLRMTLLDRSAEHLPASADGTWSASLPDPERIAADALAIPLADNSVDIVSNCLFLTISMSSRRLAIYENP